MQFKIIIEPVLHQLGEAIAQISDKAYNQKSVLLNGSSIGGHTRHVIELFQCLLQGYENGIVNYPADNKKWDHEGTRKVANVILLKKQKK